VCVFVVCGWCGCVLCASVCERECVYVCVVKKKCVGECGRVTHERECVCLRACACVCMCVCVRMRVYCIIIFAPIRIKT